MNQNFKRSFEPYAFSQYNPIKKLRLENGSERPEYASVPFSPSKPVTNPATQERRPKFKAHHKCKPVPEPPPKPVVQFKARPMPNFTKPFVPKLFKHSTTSFQEFNLSCYRSASKASTASRCDTPDSQFTNSFLSQRFESPRKIEFKNRGLIGFTKIAMPGKKKDEIMMEVEHEQQGMDLD